MRTILLDIDGVFIDIHTPLLEAANREFGTAYTLSSVTDFDFRKCLRREHGEWILKTYFQNPELYDDKEPDPSALRTVEYWRDHGYRVLAVSAPMDGHVQSKWRFLRRFFPINDIYICGDKNLVQGDVLIDDAAHNLNEWPGPIICFNKPWNAAWEFARHASTWEQVRHHVSEVMLSEYTRYTPPT